MKRLIPLLLAGLLLTSCSGSLDKPVAESEPTAVTDTQESQAQAAFSQRDYTRAATLYTLLAKAKPDDADFAFYLGESYRLNGKVDEALKSYRKALDIDKHSLHAKEGMGLALLQKRSFSDAIQTFNEVLKEDASRWRTINALGVAHALQGHLDEASKYYDMALSLSPDNASILNNIGLAYTLSGNATKGADELKKAYSNSDEGSAKRQQITYNLALAYGMLNQEDNAKSTLSPYLSEAEIDNNLGIYALLRNDRKMAKSYLSKALVEQPVFYKKANENLKNLQDFSSPQNDGDSQNGLRPVAKPRRR